MGVVDANIQQEEDLQRLIGQYESVRLDFKASALLAQPKERIVKQLTEDASAFANTEGGVIVIGIREGKAGKKSVAVEIDGGVDPAQVPPEWLEQVISENISPAVPGLTVRPIPLSGEKAGRVAYVVSVPKGTTAYQARHSLLYYGRTEFAAVPLHDHVIRLLMQRGRVAQASVRTRLRRITLGADEEAELRSKYASAIDAFKSDAEDAIRRFPELWELVEARYRPDKITFDLVLRNVGELTIRQPAIELRVNRSEQLLEGAAECPSAVHCPPGFRIAEEVIYPGDKERLQARSAICGASATQHWHRETTWSAGRSFSTTRHRVRGKSMWALNFNVPGDNRANKRLEKDLRPARFARWSCPLSLER